MRFVERSPCAIALLAVALSASAHGESLSAVHRQRYAMGTMFDIVVHHAARAEAERAVDDALDEIERLDQVMSHYKADSDLARLNRLARTAFVSADPSLHDVIRESVAVSHRSSGMFDVTIAPLLRVWKNAAAEGRRPSKVEIDEARRCVGYEKIEFAIPDRIRFRSGCVEIDLGGIGKGYAVDRAMAVLKSAGIRHALVNAGKSSIAAAGAQPGRKGWPVAVGRTVVLLQGTSISTSQQDPANTIDPIVDPLRGVPAANTLAVSVIAPRAMLADALSTALVMVPIDEGKHLVAQFAGVSAIWTSPAGEIHAAYRTSQVELNGAH